MMKFSAFFLTLFFSFAVAINSNCPNHLPKNDHLVQFQNSCYQFTLNQPGDWFKAEADCRMKKGHLVDIHNFAEQAFLFNTCQGLGFHGDKGLWIGLTDHDTYKGEGSWHWVSNNGIDFVNWAPGQPGMIGGSEDCVLMDFSEHGQWHDYPCDGFLFLSENHGWICEFPLSK